MDPQISPSDARSRIQVRFARAVDAARLAEIDSQPAVYHWLNLPGQTTTLADAEAWIRRPDQRCAVVVDAQDLVVGTITLRHTAGETEGVCLALKVDAQCWRQGNGSTLLRWLLDAADALSLERVYLAVHSENAGAIALYAQHGFIYDGQDSHGCDSMVRYRGLG